VRTPSPALSIVALGSAIAGALAAHTAVNLRLLRRPSAPVSPVRERVSVLIPARDEAGHIAATVSGALEQRGVTDLEVLVLDDASADDTPRIVTAMIEDDHRRPDVRLDLLTGEVGPVPDGWLGKPWACARLAEHASGTVLAFVDADVDLAPDAIGALVDTLRAGGFALVAPYPRQVADGWLERLLQPLVTWSWVATLPLRWAENSRRPSLSAANGQLLVIDAAAYRLIGGHHSVRGEVIEDVALMRAAKLAGLRAATVDGSHLATCRMYAGAGQVVDGYAKSLWSAFGGPAGSVAVNGLLLLVYVVPGVAMFTGPGRRGRLLGAVGYAAGVASRVLVARRTGERVLPDTLLHPASIGAFAVLNAISWWRHARGRNTWKGRPVVAAAGEQRTVEVAA
jgi:hypothetical protein